MEGPSRPSTVSPPQYHEGLEQRIEANILPTLRQYLALEQTKRVLEIASGQGVHCKVLSQHFAELSFQPTECDAYMTSQVDKTNEGNQNISKAIELDVTEEQGGWEELEKQAETAGKFDLVFVSNALHMIPYPKGPHAMFKHFNSIVSEEGLFLAYGPFKTDRGFYSESDKIFNEMIGAREDGSGLGLRSVQDLYRIAEEHGWLLVAQHKVPKGNWVLAFTPKGSNIAQDVLSRQQETSESGDSSVTLEETSEATTEWATTDSGSA